MEVFLRRTALFCSGVERSQNQRTTSPNPLNIPARLRLHNSRAVDCSGNIYTPFARWSFSSFSILTDAQILLRGGFVRFPRDQPEAGPLLCRTVVGMQRGRLLVAGLVRVARFAEVGHEVEHRFVDAHVLARVVLGKDRPALHQRQPEDVRQIFAPHAPKPLEEEEEKDSKKGKQSKNKIEI